MQQKRRNQNYIGLWFHDKNSPPADIHETMVTRLKATFEYIRVFNDLLEFTSYLLKDQLVANVVVIISSALHAPSMRELVMRRAETEENKFIGPYVLFFRGNEYALRISGVH